ncbi:MAG: right-handed parallel beta-helix repeat-containing protein [Phycisphaerae bacterium]
MKKLIVILALLPGREGLSSTYYVDYAGGSDDSAGTAGDAAFKHCPGDAAAGGKSKSVKLRPGDRIIFKGQVRYEGTVAIRASGTRDAPIVYDGGPASGFGTGRAVIDGGVPVVGWKRCASAGEAGGNPHWRKIFHALVPKSRYGSWRNLNLCDERQVLPLAQEPNPTEAIFQEDPADYYLVESKLAVDCPTRIYAEKGTRINSERPLIHMITEGRDSAVIDPVPGAAVSVEPARPVTASALGIMPQPRYAPLKDAVFLADGKEVLRVTLKKDQQEIQKFDLPSPVTFRKLTVRFLSMHAGEERQWTAVARIAAFDANGRDQLVSAARSTMADPKVLTQTDARHFDGAYLAIHAGRNMIHYQQVLEYSPAEHRLYVEHFSGRQYEVLRYAFFNSVRFIDRPGEYAVTPTADGKGWHVFCMPTRVVSGQPAGIAYAGRGKGFEVSGASHVEIRGFRIQRQGNDRSAAGVSGRGKGEGLLIRDCEVTMVNGVGITTTEIDGVTVEGCFIHHNPGHTKGVVLRNARNQSILSCRLLKNTSTGLDFYTCHNSRFVGNTVLDHRGMHANGITAYLGCTGLLVEGNRVFGGQAAFTCQDGSDFVIRNNIFGGNHRSCAMGLWAGKPLKGVRICNNTIVNGPRDVSWSAGVYCGNKGGSGFVFRNNIVDGLAGTLPADTVLEHNLITFKGPVHRDSEEGDRKARPPGAGERFVDDVRSVFVDPEKRDFRLKGGSPAIDAGMDLGAEVPTDIDGTKRPRGKAFDVGACESGP